MIFKDDKKNIKVLFLAFFLCSLLFVFLSANNTDSIKIANAAEPEYEGMDNSAYVNKNTQPTSIPAKSEKSSIAGFLAWVTLGMAWLVGKLLSVATGIVNFLFSYKDFESAVGVREGWTIVRDVCNMFFILVLLLIAFATILRMENYSMKRYLPKLLLMAVLINFSKTICLLLIDISQVVMLTFANAFTGTTSNFVTMLHVDKLLTISAGSSMGDITWDIFFAAGLALIFMIIAFFVMIMLMGILVMRIIMFWVLIVLSPLAFFTTAVPGAGKYWGQWWGEFSKYLTIGPVMAFFTWLSLMVASKQNFAAISNYANDITGGSNAFINEIAKGSSIMDFLLGIGLLIGTIKISKTIGAAGGSFGENLMNKARNKTTAFGRGIANRVGSKAAEVSYVSGAREYLKQRKAYREDLRSSRIQQQAGVIASGVGAAKANTIGWAGTTINKAWRNRIGGERAKDLRKESAEEQQQFNDLRRGAGPAYLRLKENVDSDMMKKEKYEFSDKDNKYIKADDGNWWIENKDGTSLATDKQIEKIKAVLTDQRRDAEEKRLKASIDQKNTEADKLDTRQKWADRAARAGLALGGGALTYFSGGLLSGAGASMAGAAWSWNDIKDAGNVDKKLASNYRSSKVDKEWEGMKKQETDKLFATLDNKTTSAFERMAAALELMSRKQLNAEQVDSYRNELQEKLGGYKEENGARTWNDKKLHSKYEMMADQIPGGSLLFSKAEQKDKSGNYTASAERARFEIEQMYAGGQMKLENMSTDTVKNTIDALARGMTDEKFKKSFYDLSDHMQKAIISALEKHSSYEAKAKLAWVTDIKKAFGAGTASTNAEMKRFIKSLSEEDINGIMSKGTDEQIRALIDAVNKDHTVLSESVIRNQGSRAMGNKKSLGVA